MRLESVQSKDNLLLDKMDSQPARKARQGLGNIDAIALGVEAWFEENTGYSRRVTETTVVVARALGMPEGEIKRWLSCRLSRDLEKGKVIKSLLGRLQGSEVGNHSLSYL